MPRHNLLFIFTDEQRPDTMAAYGNTLIQTPYLNRLADESVVFEKCYVTQPVCTPSRSSILTGLWPHTNGCTANNIPLRPETPCVPEMVDGCRTAYFGKWHLGDEIYAQHGFDHWVSIEDGYIAHYGPDRDRNARSSYHHYLVSKGYVPEDPRNTFPRIQAARMPEEDCKPAFLAHEVSRWLHSVSKDERFIAYVNFLEPHMPFTGPRDHQYPPESVALPGNFDNLPVERNHLRTRLLQRSYYLHGHEGMPLRNEFDWRRLIANYWGLVSQVDAALGRILETLAACGLDDDTIVVFSSDHGDMMGSHRLLAKTVMFEESARTPLLVRAPGLRPRIERAPVSQIDLGPTLLDMLGERGPDTLQGRSLRPLLETGRLEGDSDVFVEWNGANSGISKLERDETPDGLAPLATPEEIRASLRDPIRTIVTADGWKLNWSPDLGQHELFNLRDDPLETRNLYASEDCREQVGVLRRRLDAWGARTGDVPSRM